MSSIQSSHVCGMAMAAGGLGYDDLNQLMKVGRIF